MRTSAARDALATLPVGAFHKPNYGHIAAAIRAVEWGKGEIDLAVVADQTRKLGIDTVTYADIVDIYNDLTCIGSSPPRLLEILIEQWQRRQAMYHAQEARFAAREGRDYQVHIDALAELGHDVLTRDRAYTLTDSLAEWLDELEARQEQPRSVPTGLIDLDNVIGGLRAGQLIVICGRTSMGKSIFGATVALNAAETGHPTLVCSVEMGHLELTERFVATVSGINATVLRDATIPPNDWSRISDAVGHLGTVPIIIDDRPGLTVPMIRAQARNTPNLELLIVDYLQLLTAEDPRIPREQQVARISAALKVLARELEIPVIALAQLNRDVEQRRDKRPTLADLRESGAIENDADVVIGLYRDDYYNPDTKDRGVLEAIVMKQRAGATQTVRLHFDAEHTAVRNMARF